MIEILKNQSHNILVNMLSLATASFQMSITTNNPDKGTILDPRVVLSVIQSSCFTIKLNCLLTTSSEKGMGHQHNSCSHGLNKKI